MSAAPRVGASSFDPTPHQLRTLVLKYLCHHCYSNTARAFARESTVRQLDADGDELMPPPESDDADFVELPQPVLDQVLLRAKIQNFILSGKVDEAIDHLNKHFPQVLSFKSVDSATTPPSSGLEYVTSKSVEPEHVLLNLRILAFIESCRTVPLPFPPSQPSVLPSPSTSVSTSKKRSSGCLDEEDPVCQEQQTALLKSAQKLYALANVITNATHKSTYLKELANVGGLLAYKVPEQSPVSKYLSQERREAVAEQVNAAILHSLGLPTISYVELYTRYATTVYSFLREFGVKPPSSSTSQVKAEMAPQFDLHSFLA